MDTGEGTFKMIQEAEAKELLNNNYTLGIFKVGEIVELKGSHFRVKSIKLKELRLKLLASNKAIQPTR